MPDEAQAHNQATVAPPRRVRVRSALIGDLTAIVDLRLALVAEEHSAASGAPRPPDARQRAMRLTRSQLTTPGQVFLVATRGPAVVGILRCRATRRTSSVAESRQAVVTTAYVVPEERRSGVLRALLGGADLWSRKNRLSAMRLQCSLDNAGGRQAWEALGFQSAELLYLRAVPRP